MPHFLLIATMALFLPISNFPRPRITFFFLSMSLFLRHSWCKSSPNSTKKRFQRAFRYREKYSALQLNIDTMHRDHGALRHALLFLGPICPGERLNTIIFETDTRWQVDRYSQKSSHASFWVVHGRDSATPMKIGGRGPGGSETRIFFRLTHAKNRKLMRIWPTIVLGS